MTPWKAAEEVIRKLHAKGYEAYAVGGAVRDRLMNQPVRDVDVSTNASPQEVIGVFSKAIEVGLEHGTVLIPVKGTPIEVTTFRGKNIIGDLGCRDYTINAMALDKNGQVIDPFKGEDDLKKKILRAVNDPNERIFEDPLRMLRAYRFVFLFNFKIEKRTQEAIHVHASLISSIAKERAALELEKMLGKNLGKDKILDLLQCPLLTHLSHMFPSREKWLDMLKSYSHPFSIAQIEHLWYFLGAGDHEHLNEVLRVYKRSNQIKKEAKTILRVVELIKEEGWTNETLYQAGKDQLVACEKTRALLNGEKAKVEEVIDQYEKLPIKNKKDMCVNGKTLIEAFNIDEGKWVGNTLKKVEKAILTGAITNTRTAVFDYIRKERTE
ncbi:CCA tRNA nucleotidyltransferase [Alteribacter aurantiacus]|uniref:CCA tRNA nucleotidyltransferase n=1 Tax=Alteribacter aurantiacus TaxID=254410 RepID=UPI0003FC1B56|nr:CCA tRNA nucleotidyltransferase [Alteribacter aurantiacus]